MSNLLASLIWTILGCVLLVISIAKRDAVGAILALFFFHMAHSHCTAHGFDRIEKKIERLRIIK